MTIGDGGMTCTAEALCMGGEGILASVMIGFGISVASFAT